MAEKVASARLIGVGASAGGLEALLELFAAASSNESVAWVVVQHLAPDHESVVASLLDRRSRLTAVQVTTTVVPEADHIYVIAPRTQITFVDGLLTVTPHERSGELFRPVDALFESMANELGAAAVGIVLSGTGSDGSRGCQAIKERGGVVVVQEPTTAGFDGMPRSVIRTLVPDLVLPAAKIAEDIQHLAEFGVLSARDPGDVNPVLSVLTNALGLDFNHYKQAQVHRRIARRMGLLRLSEPARYAERLLDDPKELKALEFDLLIGVTRFFRDAEHHAALREEIEASWATSLDPFRVWIAGCSTGEEAFSVAMMLAEIDRDLNHGRHFRVIATDVSQLAVERAKRSRYSVAAVSDVPTAMIERYFEQDPSGSWSPLKWLRERVLFSRHDMISDPPFNRVDLVVCRNVLIYLKPVTQERVLDTFGFALNEGGLMLLGASESIGESRARWETVDARHRIFRLVQRLRHVQRAAESFRRPPASAARRQSSASPERASRSDHDIAVEKLSRGYVPAYVMFDEKFQLRYRAGDLVGLMAAPDGPTTLDVRDLFPEAVASIFAAVPARLEERGESGDGDDDDDGEDVVVRDVEVTRGPQAWSLSLRFRHLGTIRGGAWYGVVFEGLAAGQSLPARELPLDEVASMMSGRVTALERELSEVRAHLRRTVEQVESSHEELQSTNEELLASNEELQSLNEELQSVNEELQAVNAEHQVKIQQIGETSREVEVLLGSIDVAVLFLDGDLSIRRFNDRAARLLEIEKSDLGRPLPQLRLGRAPPGLVARCVEVLESQCDFDAVIDGENDFMALVRIRALVQDAGERIGVLVTLTDVSDLGRADRERESLQRALDMVSVPLFAVELDGGRVVAPNAAAIDLFDRDPRFLHEITFESLLTTAARLELAQALQVAAQGKRWSGLLAFVRGNRARVVDVRIAPPRERDGGVVMVVGEAADGSEVPESAGYVRWDAQRGACSGSSRALELLHLSSGAAAPTPSQLCEQLSSSDGARLAGAIDRSAEGMASVTVSFEYPTPDGSATPLVARVSARRATGGALESVALALWE